MSKGKSIIITILVVLILVSLLGAGISFGVNTQSTSSSPPSLPTAFYGKVMNNGVLVTSGEVTCYSDGKDISQRPSSIMQDGRYGYGSGVMICLGIPDEFRVNGEIFPQTIYGLVYGDIKELNLVKDICDSSCENVLSSECTSEWLSFAQCRSVIGFNNNVFVKRWYEMNIISVPEDEGFIKCQRASSKTYIYESNEECNLANSPNVNNLGFARYVHRGVCLLAYTTDENAGFSTRQECLDSVNINIEDVDDVVTDDIIDEIENTETSNVEQEIEDEIEESQNGVNNLTLVLLGLATLLFLALIIVMVL